MQALDRTLYKCVNGDEGGVWAPHTPNTPANSTPIVIGGDGLKVFGQFEATDAQITITDQKFITVNAGASVLFALGSTTTLAGVLTLSNTLTVNAIGRITFNGVSNQHGEAKFNNNSRLTGESGSVFEWKTGSTLYYRAESHLVIEGPNAADSPNVLFAVGSFAQWNGGAYARFIGVDLATQAVLKMDSLSTLRVMSGALQIFETGSSITIQTAGASPIPPVVAEAGSWIRFNGKFDALGTQKFGGQTTTLDGYELLLSSTNPAVPTQLSIYDNANIIFDGALAWFKRGTLNFGKPSAGALTVLFDVLASITRKGPLTISGDDATTELRIFDTSADTNLTFDPSDHDFHVGRGLTAARIWKLLTPKNNVKCLVLISNISQTSGANITLHNPSNALLTTLEPNVLVGLWFDGSNYVMLFSSKSAP
jgi:hypothetical protein